MPFVKQWWTFQGIWEPYKCSFKTSAGTVGVWIFKVSLWGHWVKTYHMLEKNHSTSRVRWAQLLGKRWVNTSDNKAKSPKLAKFSEKFWHVRKSLELQDCFLQTLPLLHTDTLFSCQRSFFNFCEVWNVGTQGICRLASGLRWETQFPQVTRASPCNHEC